MLPGMPRDDGAINILEVLVNDVHAVLGVLLGFVLRNIVEMKTLAGPFR